MPIIKSSKKRVRQSVVKTARNVRLKRDIRQAVKDFDHQLQSGSRAKIQKCQSNLDSLLDKAVKKNLYHKNKTARRKAALVKKKIAAVGSKKTTPKK